MTSLVAWCDHVTRCWVVLAVLQLEDNVEKLEGDIENFELNIQKLEEEKKSRDNQIRVRVHFE